MKGEQTGLGEGANRVESKILPAGWDYASIEELCELNPKHSKEIDDETPVSFVPMPAVSDVEGTMSPVEVRTLGEVRRGYTHFRDGDVLFAKITPCMQNGKAAIAEKLKNGVGCGSTEYFVMRSRGAVDKTILHRFVRQKAFTREAKQNMAGAVGQARVPKEYLLTRKLPIPPLKEQKRIVQKLEACESRVTVAKEALDEIPNLLEQYRQSVLAAAFRGDLTREWREKNPDEPDVSENTHLGEISSHVTSGSRGWAKYYADAGSIFIRSQDINADRLNLSEPQHIKLPNEAEGKRTRVQQNDLLVTITGANVGKTAIVDTKIDNAYVSQHVGLIRLNTPEFGQYTHLWLRAEFGGRKYLLEKAYGGGKPGLNLTNLKQVPIRLVSLTEQALVVSMVKKYEAVIDELLRKIVTDTSRNLTTLTQSLLAKAFRGDLVPQDPTDEPASELLARICAEREMDGSPKKKRAKRK